VSPAAVIRSAVRVARSWNSFTDSRIPTDSLGNLFRTLPENKKASICVLYFGLTGLSEKRLRKQRQVDPGKHHAEHLPFTVKSILELCWGLTLNLSHEKQQQDLGKLFAEQFAQIFANRERGSEDALFLQNLSMTLAGTVRNIGFVRENHVRFLNYTAQEFTEKMQNLKKVADFTSFSGSGLYAKVASFLGIGSLADLLSSVSGLVSSVGYWLTLILVFFFVGLLGALGVTLAVRKHYSDKKQESMKKEIENKQNDYWVHQFKPRMTDQLYILLSEIKRLIEKYYPEKRDVIIGNDHLLKMEDTEEVKEVISSQILPPDSLTWPTYLEKTVQ